MSKKNSKEEKMETFAKKILKPYKSNKQYKIPVFNTEIIFVLHLCNPKFQTLTTDI